MIRSVVVQYTLFSFILFTALVQAQTDCPVDSMTGNAVSQMISPVNGSTLPSGAVTFQWCNANADNFLTVESVLGAHDIFFAFAGGPGAGIESITLGPDCAPAAPTGCIPAHGETIHVTLWTLKHGVNLLPSPFQYTYTAAGSAAVHTSEVGDKKNMKITLVPSVNRLSAILPVYFQNKAVHMAVYGIGGQRQMELTVSDVNTKLTIPIGKFASGIYLFEITGAGKRIVQRFSLSQ